MTTAPDWMPSHLRRGDEPAQASPAPSGGRHPAAQAPPGGESTGNPLRELHDLLWPETYSPSQVVARARVGAAVALIEALWPLALVTPSELPLVALRSALFLLAAVGMWRRKAFGPVLALGTTASLFLLAFLTDSLGSLGFFVVYLCVFDEARRAIESRQAG